MTKCDYQNKRCEEYAYFREDLKRALCSDHYEEVKQLRTYMSSEIERGMQADKSGKKFIPKKFRVKRN